MALVLADSTRRFKRNDGDREGRGEGCHRSRIDPESGCVSARLERAHGPWLDYGCQDWAGWGGGMRDCSNNQTYGLFISPKTQVVGRHLNGHVPIHFFLFLNCLTVELEEEEKKNGKEQLQI